MIFNFINIFMLKSKACIMGIEKKITFDTLWHDIDIYLKQESPQKRTLRYTAGYRCSLRKIISQINQQWSVGCISSDNVAPPSPHCQYVPLQLDVLSAGSSYIRQRPAIGISCCSLIGRKMSKWPVIQYHNKQMLPC